MSALWVEDDHLVRRGHPEFLLADTAWAAFTRSEEREWADYLQKRHRQGFTAVLISALPIPHGRSIGAGDRSPFGGDPSGEDWDLGTLNPDYFLIARQRVLAALDAGLTPIVSVLWNNYLPDTWGARLTPYTVLTGPQTDRVITMTVDALSDLDIIYSITGDAAFEGMDGTEEPGRYGEMVTWIREAAPGALVTAHPAVGEIAPEELADLLDFHSYQSGHDDEHGQRCGPLADQVRYDYPNAPVMNLEPCYEDHLAAGSDRRHTRADVRGAAWRSITGGATAGLGYGAHGVWSWHRAGDRFTDPGYAGEPSDFRVAASLPGAEDVAFARRLVEEHDLFGMRDRPDLLTYGVLSTHGPATCAATPRTDRAIVFAPAGVTVPLGRRLQGHRVSAIDLDARGPGAFEHHDDGSLTAAARESDHLYLLQR